MKYIHFGLIFMLLAILVSNCFAQGEEVSIKNWKSYPIPELEDTLVRYNHSKVWWKVSMKGNEIFAFNRYHGNDDDPLPFNTVSNSTETILKVRGRRTVLKVSDGYLVGMNYGEWGGTLYWYANDGLSHKEISGSQIVKILTLGSNIYALDNNQKIIELKKTNTEWVAEDFVRLPQHQYPYAIATYGEDSFLVFTNESLLKIDKNKLITEVIVNGFWNKYLGPSSMVIKDNIVYAGMAGGIFKYDLVTKKKEWLMSE